ncbi:hypothetical protein Q5H92_09930 [Hymenobacter sp. M29]|uniref:STAS/SEC14 domain-containing protein n=1 Tax=Hymenobacter mellowenesis TaxID=3063995 RepID=A0ABT9AA11_9BACT|nr:hypothetical protein [Hymenobacter sp. M29]MDO7846675.1 hypothetical protein [Hymenobacter sp. M29]
MEKVFASPHINIYLHSGPVPVLELVWLDFANSDELRAALLEGLRLGRQHNIKAWLADNRLLRAIRPKDFEWMGPAIITPLHELGVRHIAVVESQDAINRFGVNAFMASVIPNTRITSQNFSTIEAARVWALQA